MSQIAVTGSAVQVRLEGPLFVAFERWRGSQPRIPQRSEALRLLIQRALSNAGSNGESERAAEGPSRQLAA